MATAKFVSEVRTIDPDTGGDVELSIFKHENGGMFAIDSSYIEQNFDDDEDCFIPVIVLIIYIIVMMELN